MYRKSVHVRSSSRCKYRYLAAFRQGRAGDSRKNLPNFQCDLKLSNAPQVVQVSQPGLRPKFRVKTTREPTAPKQEELHAHGIMKSEKMK